MNATREAIRAAAKNDSPKVEAPESDAKPTAPKVAKPKTVKVAQPCKCDVPGDKGCNGGVTKGVFAPGHDAKLVGYLTREVVAGRLAKDAAVADLVGKGGSKLLQTKLGAAIDRETAKKATVTKREADKLAAKTAREQASAFAKEQAAAVKADRVAKEQTEG